MKTTQYIAWAVIFGLAVVTLGLFFAAQHEKDQCRELKRQDQEISAMAQEYRFMQEGIMRIENAAKGEVRGVSAVMGEVLSGLDISSALKSVKNMEQKNFLDLSRQDAELVINNLNINEAVNLLYVIEKGRAPLSLRSLEMAPAFESPDVLNLRLLISYYQKK